MDSADGHALCSAAHADMPSPRATMPLSGELGMTVVGGCWQRAPLPSHHRLPATHALVTPQDCVPWLKALLFMQVSIAWPRWHHYQDSKCRILLLGPPDQVSLGQHPAICSCSNDTACMLGLVNRVGNAIYKFANEDSCPL